MSATTAPPTPATLDRPANECVEIAADARPGRSGDARPARRGVLAMAPLVIAYAPFALVIGAAAAEHGDPIAGWAGSWLIYGGSAHLAAIRTLYDAGPVMAILTGLLINARLLVYSAGLARTWPSQPRWFRFAAAGLIIDPTFALAERHAAERPDATAQRRYFIAAGLTLGVGWSAAIAAGALVGSRLDGVRLEIVVPLCLLALVGDALRVAGSRVVVVVAAFAALFAARLPAGTGLLVAVGAGTSAGLLAGSAGTAMMWVVVLTVGAGSFLFRLGPLLLLRKVVLSEQSDRSIRHAGLAAISALIALSSRQAAHSGALLPVLLAVGVGVAMAARRASMLRLILVGGGLYAGAVVGLGLLVQ